MKASLEFDLTAGNENRMDEMDDLTLAMNGRKYWCLLLNIYYEVLRRWVKYDERDAIPTDEISKKLWDVLEDSGIDLDEIS